MTDDVTHETDEQLVKAREALYSERSTEDRLRSLETGRANIVRRLQALEAQNPKAECGCVGFFHSSACSDQNVIDPLGAILDPVHRQWVRAACEKYMGERFRSPGNINPTPRKL